MAGSTVLLSAAVGVLAAVSLWLSRGLLRQRRGHARELQLASQVIDALPDALVIVDHRGRISLVNHQCETLFGYSRSALLQQPLDKLLPERVRKIHRQHVESYLRAPERRSMGRPGMRLVGQHRDGDELAIEVSLGYMIAGQLYAVALIRPVTAPESGTGSPSPPAPRS